MELVEILGYVGALMVGLVLGLIGGGGSILTVPIMVYLIGLNPIVATAYSLFVVGVTSVFGAFQNYKKGLVDVKTAIVFAVPAFIVVYLTRRYFVPIIPEVIFTVNDFEVTNDIFIMIFFSIVMLLASYSMIKGKKKHKTCRCTKQNIQLSNDCVSSYRYWCFLWYCWRWRRISNYPNTCSFRETTYEKSDRHIIVCNRCEFIVWLSWRFIKY